LNWHSLRAWVAPSNARLRKPLGAEVIFTEAPNVNSLSPSGGALLVELFENPQLHQEGATYASNCKLRWSVSARRFSPQRIGVERNSVKFVQLP